MYIAQAHRLTGDLVDERDEPKVSWCLFHPTDPVACDGHRIQALDEAQDRLCSPESLQGTAVRQAFEDRGRRGICHLVFPEEL